jgi:hypothetical protein
MNLNPGKLVEFRCTTTIISDTQYLVVKKHQFAIILEIIKRKNGDNSYKILTQHGITLDTSAFLYASTKSA